MNPYRTEMLEIALSSADPHRLSPRLKPARSAALTLAVALLAGTAACSTHMGPPPQAVASAPPPMSGGLSLDTPIEQICARPDGKAVVDRDLPGLTRHPEFPVFKSMSLKTLAAMSNGKLPPAKLTQVGDDLAKLPPAP